MPQINTQSLSDHLQELRSRLFIIALVLVTTTATGFILRDSLIEIISRPLSFNLHYTTPAGGFMLAMNISLLFGILVSIPVIVYQLGKFITPAFPRLTNRGLIAFVLWSFNLALAGAMFAYFLSFPAAIDFLTGFAPAEIIAIITAEEYIRFATIYIGGFALMFQVPLILLMIDSGTHLPPGTLLKLQRPLILSSFIAAALITPTPDPFNQLMMAVPPILLFYVAVGMIWVKSRFRRTKTVVATKKAAVSIPVIVEDEGPSYINTSWQKSQPRRLILDIKSPISAH